MGYKSPSITPTRVFHSRFLVDMTIETNLEKASKSTRVVSENREEVTATTKLVG